MKTLLVAAGFAAIAFAAQAQAPGQTDPTSPPDTVTAPPASAPAGPQEPVVDPAAPQTTPDASEAAKPSSATTLALKTGATVKDGQGQSIGTITSVGDGTVTLSVDGKAVTVPQASLISANGGVVSSQTKAQILNSKKN